MTHTLARERRGSARPGGSCWAGIILRTSAVSRDSREHVQSIGCRRYALGSMRQVPPTSTSLCRGRQWKLLVPPTVVAVGHCIELDRPVGSSIFMFHCSMRWSPEYLAELGREPVTTSVTSPHSTRTKLDPPPAFTNQVQRCVQESVSKEGVASPARTQSKTPRPRPQPPLHTTSHQSTAVCFLLHAANCPSLLFLPLPCPFITTCSPEFTEISFVLRLRLSD